ncbi:B-cell receptor CD22-like [Periophthalmus magnuspinnatus]|uniref:B-cell receptor CD22-like n=1 Tax=Periophthalmus magnuspinnatus TaxID=409849 RepID=UPI002436C8E3|nr:B-cell receptor CD22-like [Periophthalmus magnuspinnatus]
METHPISCLILLVTAVPCYSNSYATIETPSLAAFVGTCVEIKCKVTGEVPDEDALWFWMKDGTWFGSEYSGTIVYNPCLITFDNPAPVQENHDISLTCSTPKSCSKYLEIESVPPSGLRTSQSSVSFTATASFRASWRDNNKEFTCQTRGNKDPQLIKKIRISVLYKPKNTNTEIVGQTREVEEGRSVTFKCNSDANPHPGSYYWYKDSKYIQYTAVNRLEMEKVQRADEGCYSCRATNKHGSGGHSTAVCIQVSSPPTSLTLSMDSEAQ